MVPEFCVLVAIDREHLEEFRVVYPTWLRHKPSLANRPIVFVIDSCSREDHYHIVGGLIETIGQERFGVLNNARLCQLDQSRPHANQREKMLAGLAIDGPRYIKQWLPECGYFLKLDCDAPAVARDNWISPNWFANSPAIIASPWPYTRPASQLAEFAKWSDPLADEFPNPMPQAAIRGERAYHRRMISYCQFGNVDWACKMAEIVKRTNGDRLPIPSQDGFAGLCAARSGAEIRYVKMKDYGWQHVGSSLKRLREAAAIAMEMPTT